MCILVEMTTDQQADAMAHSDAKDLLYCKLVSIICCIPFAPFLWLLLKYKATVLQHEVASIMASLQFFTASLLVRFTGKMLSETKLSPLRWREDNCKCKATTEIQSYHGNAILTGEFSSLMMFQQSQTSGAVHWQSSDSAIRIWNIFKRVNQWLYKNYSHHYTVFIVIIWNG